LKSSSANGFIESLDYLIIKLIFFGVYRFSLNAAGHLVLLAASLQATNIVNAKAWRL